MTHSPWKAHVLAWEKKRNESTGISVTMKIGTKCKGQ